MESDELERKQTNKLISIGIVAALVAILFIVLMSSFKSPKKIFKTKYRAFGGDCGCLAGMV